MVACVAVWMKRSKNMLRVWGLIGTSLLLLGLANGFAISPSTTPKLANFDQRETANPPVNPSTNQAAALFQLQSRVPQISVDFNPLLGTPQWVASTRGFLSGAGGAGRAVSPQSLTQFSVTDPDRITKAFITEHRDLFGHGPELLNKALLKREFTTPHNGLRTMVWQQQVDEIPVFEALLISHTTTNDELVNISSHFLPDLYQAADAGTPGRAALQTTPTVSAPQAIVAAAQNIGETLPASGITALDAPSRAPDKHQRFKAAPLKGEADAHLVWLPMSRFSLRLCWEVVLMSRARGEMFQILIDARTGAALLRHGLTENLSDASYRVFVSDSPRPMSPGYGTPVTTQPAQIPRVLIVTNAFNTNASPNGWINDGDNETTGNNVDAHLDRNADNLPDLPRPRGAPFRVFDPPLDLTQDPLTYGDAAVVNLFFWNNWMHDKLYEFGFSEAAGNFQVDNFGRGGSGNDPVQADAQDGSGFNNANFSTPPDGLPGRMQMYIFAAPTPNRDGDLDSQVMVHEYTHGLSNRRVGGGVGISALQSRGLGEGWSDFYSLALLSKPGDDVDAIYPEAAYASYWYSGLTQNYYYGIRRYPYTTDLTRNPGTLKDIDPGQADSHPGIPRSPITINSATEIHNQGEIWCAALWDARANLIHKYGFAVGNPLILQLVTDGMNLTPANPTFLQTRDGIIQADLVDTGGANFHELWLAFAKRGMGDGAVVPPSSTTSGVVESFAFPDDLLVTPPSDLNVNGTIGGPFTPSSKTYKLCNTDTNILNWNATTTDAWIDFSNANGTLAAGETTNIVVSINASAGNLAIGNYAGTVTFSNLNSGKAQSRALTLNISPPRIFYFSFDSDPGWSRQGQWAFGQPTGQGGATHGNPDPTGGANGSNVFGVNLDGDYSTAAGGPYYLTLGPLNFSNATSVVLQFQRWLNSDYRPFAAAEVEVSNDGTNWTTLFANAGVETKDAAWTRYQYDVSSVVDNQPAAYVRWGYQTAAGAFSYSGWNIDDVAFLGMTGLQFVLPLSATEGDGNLVGQGHLR
ncbi:MAG: Peptidase fungalysin, partial [Pedosphaera sp.]|nr:Peptidase fungalysin [Pedosphaera sp.]